MSEVMIGVLQRQVESLTRQVEQLGPENERVRKLLTEFDKRHNADQCEIARLKLQIGDLGICGSCMGSGESGPDQICQSCEGSGADRSTEKEEVMANRRLTRPLLSAMYDALSAALANPEGFDGGDFEGLSIEDFERAQEWLRQEKQRRYGDASDA